MLWVLPARRRARPPAELLERAFEAWGRARQRRALAELPDSLLADIGLSRAQAQEEAEKPFWRR